MKQSIIFCYVALLNFYLVSPAPAAELCTMDDTEASCSDAIRAALAERMEIELDETQPHECAEDDGPTSEKKKEDVEAMASDQANMASHRLTEKNTGMGNSGISNVDTVVDFLSFLGIDFDTGGLSRDDNGNLTVELNDFLGLPTDDGYKLQAMMNAAEIYQPLLDAIPEDVRSDRKDAFEKQVDDFDDLSFVFTYSPMTEKLGRSAEIHSSYFTGLFENAKERIDAYSEVYSEASSRQLNLIDGLAQRLEEKIENSDGQAKAEFEALLEGLDEPCIPPSFTELADKIDPSLAQDLLDATEQVEAAWFLRNVAFERTLAETQFFRFADLVDNQPQLNFSFTVSSRNELVGPDEVKGKATYEHGFVNVNKLDKYTEKCLADDPKPDDPLERRDELSCFQDYMTQERMAQMKRGDRLAFSLEYSDVDDYMFALPDDMVMLNLEGDRKIIGSLVYGRYLNFDEEGRGQSRIDFSGSYEDVGSDPMRQDRWLLSLTYAQRVAGDLIFSAGISYASEPEFLGEVDEEINARVGLTYKLFKDDKKF